MKLSIVLLIFVLIVSSISAESVAYSDSASFFKGFFSGAQIFVPNFDACIGQNNDIGNQIIMAILNIQSGDLATDLSSLKNIGAAFETFPKALIQCNTTQQDIDQIKSLINVLVHPSSDFKILKNIFTQRAQIEQQFNSIAKCAKSKDFECVGNTLGSMLNNLIIKEEEVVLQKEQNSLDIIVVNNVSNSFLKGYLYGIGVRSIKFYTCLTDSQTIANIVYDALDEYEAKNYLTALEKIGQAVINLPDMMVQCNATQSDIDLVKDSADWFLHPAQSIKDLWTVLVSHGGQTFNDIKTSFEDLKTKKYYDAGSELAQIYLEIIQKQEDQMLLQEAQEFISVSDIKESGQSVLLKISQFYEGYFQGLGLTVPDILGCINSDSNEYNIMAQMSSIIYGQGSKISKLKALKYIFQLLKHLPEALSQCDSGKDDILFASRSINWLKSPFKSLEMVIKNIEIEREMIMQQINQSYEYLKTGEPKFAGFQLGSAFRELFLQEAVETNE